MKKTKIIYWTSTILFAGLMIFSAIPDIAVTEEAKQFIMQLGYPVYFMPLIGVAKLLGCLAILTPGFKRIKEWAYAGLFFDLIGAVYSVIMKFGIDPSMLFFVFILALGTTSYVFHRKMNDEL